jgi:Xaa-Pro aminopeptidase
MVLTVEPGIYIRPDQSIPLKWHNLGIRVEDDVLVTSAGASVLSQQLVKRSEEIEAFMA